MRPALASRILRSAALTAATVAVAATGARAQEFVETETGALPLELRADALYRQGRHHESLQLLEEYLDGTPGDYGVQVMAAREALILGYVATVSDSAKAWYRRSIAHGEKAQGVDPDGTDGRYITLAAEGRLALLEGARAKAHLGAQVEREALDLLAADSLHAGAHNAVGRLYLEIARLSSVERFLARMLMGSSVVSRATWESAESHLRRAVELQPERNFYYVDLGSLLFSRGRLDEARDVLEEGLRVPLEIPAQEGFRAEARDLLKRIEEREARQTEGA